MNQTAQTSAALRVQAEQIADSYLSTTHIGAPSTLREPDKVQLLLASIRDGNYRETAIRQAGISKQTFYNWLKRAEAGDVPAMAFVDALEKAEADAEAETVANVRKASQLPQFWAAGMTYLERKHPDKWGRRQDDASVPKVVVQIGVRDSDVQVQIALSPPTFAPDALEQGAVSGDLSSLRLPIASDKGGYGYLDAEAVPSLDGQTDQPRPARDPAGDPTPVAGASSGLSGRGRVKGSGVAGKKKGSR